MRLSGIRGDVVSQGTLVRALCQAGRWRLALALPCQGGLQALERLGAAQEALAAPAVRLRPPQPHRSLTGRRQGGEAEAVVEALLAQGAVVRRAAGSGALGTKGALEGHGIGPAKLRVKPITEHSGPVARAQRLGAGARKARLATWSLKKSWFWWPRRVSSRRIRGNVREIRSLATFLSYKLRFRGSC